MSVAIVGTSRLHEPSEIALNSGHFDPLFLHAGYFHSPRQILNLLEIAFSGRRLDDRTRSYFFRRDGLPSNPFDVELWAAGELGEAAQERLSQRICDSEALLLEVSSLQEFRLDGVSLQGNPNVHRSAPYAEVWREGYYHHYDQGLGVRNETTSLEEAISSFSGICELADRPVYLLSHLVGTEGAIPVRRELEELLMSAIEGLPIKFISTRDLVDRFGFRVLDTGVTDMHHLPVEGCEALAERLGAALKSSSF